MISQLRLFGTFRRILDRSSVRLSSSLENLRNIGIAAHVDSGKTTVTERLLYYTGRIDSMHEVRGKDGVGAVMDSMELERQRGITIQSAATFVTWKGTDINIIDTPGHVDFTVEVERALRVLDGAVLVMCASGGVQSQTITVLRQMQRYSVPYIIFINKLDRVSANPLKCLEGLRKKLNIHCAFVHIPMGLENDLCGIVDIISNEAIYFEGTCGTDIRRGPVPPEFTEQREEKYMELVGTLADIDDSIAEKFLMEEPVSAEEVSESIRKSVLERTFHPILMGSALRNVGIQNVLDSVVSWLPRPNEVDNFANRVDRNNDVIEKVKLDSARDPTKTPIMLAFKLETGKFGQLTYFRMYQGRVKVGQSLCNTRTGKTVKITRLVKLHASELIDIPEAFAGDIFAIFGVDCASGDTFTTSKNRDLSLESMHVPKGVMSLSIESPKPNTEKAFRDALARFAKEDPSFTFGYDNEAKEFLITGMGELHLEIYCQRMEREYNCPVNVGQPKVAFRETIINEVDFTYEHKKQSGGRGQYGKVIGVARQNDDILDSKFNDKLVGTNLPRNYTKPLCQGFKNAMEKGPQIGAPFTGLEIDIIDGAYHQVDSSEISFMLCGEGAVEQIYEKCQKSIIEPIMNVEISYPDEFDQRVLPLLYDRHVEIQSTETDYIYKTVYGQCPLNDMFGFTGALRSVTEGKGEFAMEYSHYDHCRDDVMIKMITDCQQSLPTGKSKAPKNKK